MGKHRDIYNSARWDRIRKDKLHRDFECEYCPPHRRRAATVVDHFIAISDGCDPWDWNNLRSACKKCHDQKTVRGERVHGCDINGMPLDPKHPWNNE